MNLNQPLTRMTGGLACLAAAACLYAPGRVHALDVIDPSGTLYTGVSANSEYDPVSYGGLNMFDSDVSGVVAGDKLYGADWARVGVDPGYLAFQLDSVNTVGSVFYAQRAGSNPVLDKVNRLSVWTSATTPFAASDPGVEPSTIVAVTETGGATWKEYLFTNNLTGRYFLVKIEQSPNVGGNIGGNELRLGLANLSDPPVLTQQPQPRVLYPGGAIRLSIAATGTAPLSYQWKHGSSALANSTRVTGADSADLVIQTVTDADAGSYTCTVVNSAGKAVSDATTVTVLSAASGFDGAVLSNSPAAYWSFDEAEGSAQAHDLVNSLDGTYGSFSLCGQPGPRQADLPGFSAANTAVQTTGFTVESAVALPSLGLYTNTVTIVAWINPQDAQQPYSGIVFNRNPGTTAGLIFSGDGTKLAYQWNGTRFDFDSGLVIPSGQWSMVAMSVTSSNATLYLGTDGQLNSRVDTASMPNQYFTGTTYAGLDTDVGESARTFNGLIDDVAVFGRALSPMEIQGLFSAAAGQVQATPVEFTTQPSSQNLGVGDTLTLSPVVVGTVPITYQWFTGSGPVTGAQSLTYNVASVSAADAGDYYVVASNAAGSVTSAVVHVTVLAQALQVLDPTGALYTGVVASSEFPSGGYEGVNLFTTDVSGLAIGDKVAGSDWAENGSAPGYLAFQLDKAYSVYGLFYAQRAGSDAPVDKVTRISLWADSDVAFDPLFPPTSDPVAVFNATETRASVWARYLFSGAVTGRYFLVKVEQDPKVQYSNLGGTELRLGVAVTPEKLQWKWTSSGLVLTWTSGTLQSAGAITGPWSVASGVVSGSPLPASETQKYFRLKY
jgi:hypothetical protein